MATEMTKDYKGAKQAPMGTKPPTALLSEKPR